MQVSLKPESEAIFAEIMQSGAYDSPEDLMAAAMEALYQKIAYFDAERFAVGEMIPCEAAHHPPRSHL